MATDTILRTGEIKDILLREIEAADLHELDVEEVGTVLEVKDGIARIYGLQKAMAGEMLEVTSSETGEKITALALNLEEDNIGSVVLGDYLQLKEGDEVRRTARVLEVPVGRELVSRVGGGETSPGGRDGVHHRRRRGCIRSGSYAVHRALLRLRDGRVLHVQRRSADPLRLRRFVEAGGRISSAFARSPSSARARSIPR